jgi:phosphomannomutase
VLVARAEAKDQAALDRLVTALNAQLGASGVAAVSATGH